MFHDRVEMPTNLIDTAREVLQPDRFGFRAHRQGWLRDFPDVGDVAFASLAWPHAQVSSYHEEASQWKTTNALGLLVRLQQRVWGFPPDEAVPVNVLSILEDTGGAVIVAYDPDKGFNSTGWLGFGIGMGTRSGVLYSHMLGVREDIRGGSDLGWYLKVLQAHLALESGHHAMTWTFDPLRGANARLNVEKLGARMINLTIDKYGVMRSALYGNVPTDRFTAYWNLIDPATHQRLDGVADRSYKPLTLADIENLPEATPESLEEIVRAQPEAVAYRIPGDVDVLMQTDAEAAVHWRQQMREVLGELMTLRRAKLDRAAGKEDPIGVEIEIAPGPYEATGFATGIDSVGERSSYYVLTKGTGS
jgi:chorismate synthase